MLLIVVVKTQFSDGHGNSAFSFEFISANSTTSSLYFKSLNHKIKGFLLFAAFSGSVVLMTVTVSYRYHV